jgi:hypothetical protein
LTYTGPFGTEYISGPRQEKPARSNQISTLFRTAALTDGFKMGVLLPGTITYQAKLIH